MPSKNSGREDRTLMGIGTLLRPKHYTVDKLRVPKDEDTTDSF